MVFCGEEIDDGRPNYYAAALGEEQNSWTSGNCTLRDGKDAIVRFLLGYEMVGRSVGRSVGLYAA
jgi:hypothetical protein